MTKLQDNVPSHLKVLAVSSDGNPLILYSDNFNNDPESIGNGRVIIGCSLEKFTVNNYDKSVGISRYIVNATVWLLSLEFRLANAKSIKGLFKMVEKVLTGEEKDTCLYQGRAKLFIRSGQTWSEKGVGLLKLNEASNSIFRLIMRVEKSFRLIMNAILFPEMSCEKVRQKELTLVSIQTQNEMSTYLIRFNTTEERNNIYELIQSKKLCSCIQQYMN